MASDLTEQVVAELCAYLGNDTCTTTETADKLIALITEANIQKIKAIDEHLPSSESDRYQFRSGMKWEAIRALGEGDAPWEEINDGVWEPMTGAPSESLLKAFPHCYRLVKGKVKE